MIKNAGITILYGDVAPNAKENFVSKSENKEFDTLFQLQQYNLDFPPYENPCEPYSVILDGTALPVPSDKEKPKVGFWSKDVSNDNGDFVNPVVLELQSVGQYSSKGLGLTFDTYNGVYPTRLKIKWFRVTEEGETLLSEKEYMPNDSFYFCWNFVENYNKLIITFYSLSFPNARLKLRSIDYGFGRLFTADEVLSAKLIQETDPISSKIPISTADIEIRCKDKNVDYLFQQKQPFSIYFNKELRASTFIKEVKRKARDSYKIESEDYIGLMDSIPFYGGIYENEKAVDILADIFSVSRVPYIVDSVFADATVTGYIPYTTCRDALMQVAFAIQAVVDTSDSELVKIFALEDDVKQTIPLNRIMQDQNFVDDDVVTAVEVSVHSYKPTTETANAYDASQSGTGEKIFVKFNEPLHDLSITNGSFAVDEKGNELKHTNYAVINANENCILTGQKYEHTTQTRRKNNPIVLASAIEKVVAIQNATLVSKYNIDNVINKCYNWIVKSSSINLKIVEGKRVEYGKTIKYGEKKYGEFLYGEKTPNVVYYDQPVSLGEKIKVKTEYLGDKEGIITKQSFNLNGGMIVKDIVMR